MWQGNIVIENSKACVEAVKTNTGMFKEWHGQGQVVGKDFIGTGQYETELGIIIVDHIDLLSGHFTFVGSGEPYIEL